MKNLKSKTLKFVGATMLAVLKQNEYLPIWHKNLITLMLFVK